MRVMHIHVFKQIPYIQQLKTYVPFQYQFEWIEGVQSLLNHSQNRYHFCTSRLIPGIFIVILEMTKDIVGITRIYI